MTTPAITATWSNETLDRAAAYYKQAMELIGVDFKSLDTQETPRRVMKMWKELFSSVGKELQVVKEVQDHTYQIKLMQFDKRTYDQMVTCQQIPFVSTCSHHHILFTGKGHIGYVPGKGLMGLSKMGRVLEFYARQPQSQEALSEQVCQFIFEQCKPKFVIVLLQAEHGCMTCRGAKKHGAFTTTCKILSTKSLNSTYVRDLKTEFLTILSLNGGKL